MASSSAILPGPMRSPLVKSRRMLKRVSAMDAARLRRLRPDHREFTALVKRSCPAPPTRRQSRPRCHLKHHVARENRSIPSYTAVRRDDLRAILDKYGATYLSSPVRSIALLGLT